MNRIMLCIAISIVLIGCSNKGGGSSTRTNPDVDPPTPIDTSKQPNILLIISDDQGLDASAQYSVSTDLPNTPNLDALAKKGVIYDNAWATPACTTTRGTMITGKHGINSGIDYVPAKMDTSTETLQRYLKNNTVSANYESAVIGKWHIAGAKSSPTHPKDSGIEYFAGLIEGVVDSYTDWTLTLNGAQSQSNQYHTSQVTDLAIDWIGQQTSPWFLWLAYVAPHSPYHLPPSDLLANANLSGDEADINANKRAYYLAAIEAMDTEIGRLLNAMSNEERENTVIIYLGDNGTPAAVIDTKVYARQHSKSSLYEGGIRVPMFVSGKGISRENEREEALVNTTDIFATISELAGNDVKHIHDSYSFADTFTTANKGQRAYNYSEFKTDLASSSSGWTVRNSTHKLIELEDGKQELYDLTKDLAETNDLLTSNTDYTSIVTMLKRQAELIRNTSSEPIDITNKLLSNRSANCADYANQYQSSATDVNNQKDFKGSLSISVANGKCVFNTNAIPNHDFNDGERSFPNQVSEQDDTFEVTTNPTKANAVTALSLLVDNALLLNGVKVDILAAGCFGVENGKIGCHDMSTPWRYDPMFASNGFRVDSHNAHAQGDGTYHYHGTPNAFYDQDDSSKASPIIGFAADGFPIFGPYFDDNGNIRKATSSYRLKSGNRPSGEGNPGGSYDGTFRDDYEFAEGLGDLDQCNGMTIDGVYGYYITDEFPYVIACFTGTPDASFKK